MVAKSKKMISLSWPKALAVAICFFIVACIVVVFINRNTISLRLSDNGIVVRRAKESNSAFQGITSSTLAFLTEDELVNGSDYIFEGKIVGLYNLEVIYAGTETEEPYASPIGFAEIKVTSNLKGDLPVEKTVKVMLPNPVNLKNAWIEDTEILSQFEIGTTGIFMSFELGDENYREANGKRLYYSDLAELAIADGERYAFLQKDEDIVFSRGSYLTIENALELGEVKAFLLWKLGKGEKPAPFSDGRAFFGPSSENLPISYEQAQKTATTYAEVDGGLLRGVSPCNWTYPNAKLTEKSLQANPALAKIGYPKDLPIYIVNFIDKGNSGQYLYVLVDAQTGEVLTSYTGASCYIR